MAIYNTPYYVLKCVPVKRQLKTHIGNQHCAFMLSKIEKNIHVNEKKQYFYLR